MNKGKYDYKEILILGIVALVLITLFSACSPLYPVNPWSDPNWYLTIGKGMLHGQMPYRDLWDQKGPSLYMLQGLMALISETSLFGAYVVEVICLWVSMHFSFRTMRLFTDNPICLPLTCVLFFFAVTSDFFYWGETVEELCLPFLCYTSYRMFVYARKNVLPGWLASLVIGMGMAFIFWCKFTNMMYYLGALMAILIVSYNRNDMKRAWRTVAWIVGGFVLLSAVIVCFYVVIGAIQDMWQSYFITNLFLYNTGEKKQMQLVFMIMRVTGLVVLGVLPWFAKVDRDVKCMALLPWDCISVFFTFAPIDTYYFTIMFYMLPVLIYFFRRVRMTRVVWLVFGLYCIGATALNYNFVYLVTGRMPDTVNHMAEIVNNDPSHPRQLLSYRSYATAIYIKTDCQSPVKYFSAPLSRVSYKSIQDSCLASCRCKYVLVKAFRDEEDEHIMDGNTNYRKIYETTEDYRYMFLGDPLLYLWSLGYTQPLMKPWFTPEKDAYIKWGHVYMLYVLRNGHQAGGK